MVPSGHAIARARCLTFGISFCVVKISDAHERTVKAFQGSWRRSSPIWTESGPRRSHPPRIPTVSCCGPECAGRSSTDPVPCAPSESSARRSFAASIGSSPTVKDGTVLRHTIEGEVFGEYEAIWRDRIDPATTWCSKRYSTTCSRSLNERVAPESRPVRQGRQRPSVTVRHNP